MRFLMMAAALGVAVFLSAVLAAQNPPAVDPAVQPEYLKRAAALPADAFKERLALAGWCVDKGLLREAEDEIIKAAAVNPKADEVASAWMKLIGKTPEVIQIIRVEKKDGGKVWGECALKPYLLKVDTGYRMLRAPKVRELKFTGIEAGKPVVEAHLAEGVVRGALTMAPTLNILDRTGAGPGEYVKVPVAGVLRIVTEVPWDEPVETDPPEEGARLPAEAGDAAAPDKPAATAKDWPARVRELQRSGLEVMLVIDSTGSMGGILLELKTRLRPLARALTAAVPNARLGFVFYRDRKQFDLDDYEYTATFVPLQKGDKEGLDKLSRFMREAEAYGGGDIPEAVLDGVETAVDKAGWSKDARRAIVVIGDAPPHPENDGLAKTYAACKAWKDAGGMLSCIDTTGEGQLMPEFRKMAEAGGGEAFILNDERQILRQVLIAVFGSAYTTDVEKLYGPAAGPKDETPAEE